MKRRSRIIRMDKWDIFARESKLRGEDIPLCDMSERLSIHKLGNLVYFSFYRRCKKGIPFDEIKNSAEYAEKSARDAISFIKRFIRNTEGWAIITTPKRRHFGGFHFASFVCSLMSSSLGIPFYSEAVQCINRSRLEPQFHLLRPIEERKLIVYDDIITTGTTLKVTNELLGDRDIVLNIVSINNR